MSTSVYAGSKSCIAGSACTLDEACYVAHQDQHQAGVLHHASSLLSHPLPAISHVDGEQHRTGADHGECGCRH